MCIHIKTNHYAHPNNFGGAKVSSHKCENDVITHRKVGILV